MCAGSIPHCVALRHPINKHIRLVGGRPATSRHSDFAALRHDVLKRFKGASLYKVGRDLWLNRR